MVTNKVYVNNKGIGREEALAETEHMSDYLNLSRKNKLHIRLLTEEMLGMAAEIGGEFDAEFWVETEGKTYRLCLEAEMNKMSTQKKDKLISVSTSGKNASDKGFMSKLKNVFEMYWLFVKNTEDYDKDMSLTALEYFPSSICSSKGLVTNLQLADLGNQKERDNNEEWDELEKSIVANIADDVSVGVKGETVALVITKKL